MLRSGTTECDKLRLNDTHKGSGGYSGTSGESSPQSSGCHLEADRAKAQVAEAKSLESESDCAA